MPKGETEFPHQRTVHFGADDIETALTAKTKYGMAVSTFIRRAYQLGKKAALDECRRKAQRDAAIKAKKRAAKGDDDGA